MWCKVGTRRMYTWSLYYAPWTGPAMFTAHRLRTHATGRPLATRKPGWTGTLAGVAGKRARRSSCTEGATWRRGGSATTGRRHVRRENVRCTVIGEAAAPTTDGNVIPHTVARYGDGPGNTLQRTDDENRAATTTTENAIHRTKRLQVSDRRRCAGRSTSLVTIIKT